MPGLVAVTGCHWMPGLDADPQTDSTAVRLFLRAESRRIVHDDPYTMRTRQGPRWSLRTLACALSSPCTPGPGSGSGWPRAGWSSGTPCRPARSRAWTCRAGTGCGGWSSAGENQRDTTNPTLATMLTLRVNNSHPKQADGWMTVNRSRYVNIHDYLNYHEKQTSKLRLKWPTVNYNSLQ